MLVIESRKIISQIVPRLPPVTDGVGDYAFNLARQLRQDHNIQTHFIVCDRTWSGEKTIDDFPISHLSTSNAESLSSLLLDLQTQTVLLHYVGYGYAKRGCPIWLVDGLKSWHTNNSQHKLVTMFHEVCASGAIWTSAFWLSQIQKRIATGLVQLSDRILTSKQLYAEILGSLSQGKHLAIPAMPVFSNIGEPKQVSLLSQRQPWLVIFGGSNNRQKAYLKSQDKISFVCQRLGIEKIIDIGKPTKLSLSNLNGIPIQEMGRLSVSQIPEIFLICYAGFLDYNPKFLAKSGIFASYCAYGMLPISANFSDFSIDGIEPGRHYWIACEHLSEKNCNSVQAIADNAHAWYQNHNLFKQTNIFVDRLTK